MKHVKHVDRPRKAHCINRAKRVAIMIFDNFQDSGPSPFHGFAVACLSPN